ncbi:ParB N-terminal domain-containing protein [Candidatus Micrarchaeota archaeon]|nr:ParB N-terminal domain-containing protein [Candidatus Micrarchaeota archaeon]
MVVGLVPSEEQERIFKKLMDYYRALYPGLEFSKKEKKMTHKELGEVYCTYAGEEAEATAKEKMRMISSAIGEGYSTPIIILEKNGKMILLDGHRRIRVAYAEGLEWPALVMVPSKNVKFGIEDMIMGKVKDLYGK